jgi:hypothetical protein
MEETNSQQPNITIQPLEPVSLVSNPPVAPSYPGYVAQTVSAPEIPNPSVASEKVSYWK